MVRRTLPARVWQSNQDTEPVRYKSITVNRWCRFLFDLTKNWSGAPLEVAIANRCISTYTATTRSNHHAHIRSRSAPPRARSTDAAPLASPHRSPCPPRPLPRRSRRSLLVVSPLPLLCITAPDATPLASPRRPPRPPHPCPPRPRPGGARAGCLATDADAAATSFLRSKVAPDPPPHPLHDLPSLARMCCWREKPQNLCLPFDLPNKHCDNIDISKVKCDYQQMIDS
jgi:hypothetical protein